MWETGNIYEVRTAKPAAGEPSSAADNATGVVQHLTAVLTEEAECEPPLGLGHVGMGREAPLPPPLAQSVIHAEN